MNCPICNVALRMTERQGIEIDYCPQCRGVWLDRGELDKIIERSVSQPSPQQSPQAYPEKHDYQQENRQHDDKHHEYGHKGHKRKSFLSELFD
jgi:Zn-finger nucleic acid-binding protein